jgi:hypothetical protein
MSQAPLNFVQELLAAAVISVIHTVKCEPSDPRLPVDQVAQTSRQGVPVRIARDELVLPPGGPIGRDHSKALYILQQWDRMPVSESKCDARYPYSVEIALKDRRHAKPPGGKYQDETLGTL